MTTLLPIIPHPTAEALRKNGWTTPSRGIAERDFGAGVTAIIRSDGKYFITVNGITRASGQEPPHETLSWLICCTAMEANEVAWSQPEYKAQWLADDQLIADINAIGTEA